MYYNYLNTSFRSQAIILSELNFEMQVSFVLLCVFFLVRSLLLLFSSLVLLHFVSFLFSCFSHLSERFKTNERKATNCFDNNS